MSRKGWVNEDCPDKRKKIIWNDQDCIADTCLRPPGTSNWVQCDSCSGWYHVECLKLKLEEVDDEDKDFYCPTCIPDKEEQFLSIKDKLKARVEELAERQVEFGGVTIDRDLFKEKKNANPFNYSQDFPPTLRDLSTRIANRHKTIADFKKDYKVMCKQLTLNLKEDLESRIQMVEWELDDIVEEVFKDDPVEEEEKVEEETIEESVEQLKDSNDSTNFGGLCSHCQTRFSSPIIYRCKVNHKVCYPCRNLVTGCFCPKCLQLSGIKKRLMQDAESSLMYRLANASNFDSDKLLTAPKNPVKRSKAKRKSEEGGMSPRIMNVWSCSDQLVMDADVTVKTEPGTDTGVVAMASVIPESDMGSKMLTLIDPDIVASSSPVSPEQQPVNYNDTEDQSESSIHTANQSENSIHTANQSQSKVRRVSSEDWVQSLEAASVKATTDNVQPAVWARYKERAKLNAKVVSKDVAKKFGGGYTIAVNADQATPVKYIIKKAAPATQTSSVPQSSQHDTPVPEANQQHQPSDQYLTQQSLQSGPKLNQSQLTQILTSAKSITSSSLDWSTFVPTLNQSSTSKPSVKIVQVKRLPPKSPLTLSQPYDGLPSVQSPQVISNQGQRKIFLKRPKNVVNVVKSQPLNFYVDPTTLEKDPLATDDMEISTDAIAESFNEIEKFLGADGSDNIFETETPSVQPPKMMSYYSPQQQRTAPPSLPPPPKLTPAPNIIGDNSINQGSSQQNL